MKEKGKRDLIMKKCIQRGTSHLVDYDAPYQDDADRKELDADVNVMIVSTHMVPDEDDDEDSEATTTYEVETIINFDSEEDAAEFMRRAEQNGVEGYEQNGDEIHALCSKVFDEEETAEEGQQAIEHEINSILKGWRRVPKNEGGCTRYVWEPQPEVLPQRGF